MIDEESGLKRVRFDIPAVLPDAVTQEEWDRRERLERRREVARRFSRFIRQNIYQAFIRDEIEETATLVSVRDFLTSPQQILILAGPPGTGKTIAGLDALCRMRGDMVKAMNISQATNPWGDEAGRFDQVSITSPLLVIDDLGVERDVTQRFVTDLGMVIDERQGVMRDGTPFKTIITTNMKPSELKSRYGERTRDRFNGLTMDKIILERSMR